MLVWMCSAHVNQRSPKNCIIPLGFGAARGDYIGLGFLTQTAPGPYVATAPAATRFGF